MNSVQSKFSVAKDNLMKKILFLFLVVTLATPAGAQISQDFLLDTEAVASMEPDENAVSQAEESAKKLLQQKPRALRKQTFPKLRSTPAVKQEQVVSRNQEAPFGLIWGASMAETKNQGIILTPIGEKDYVNNFSATHLPKEINDIARVDITFGEDDHLWRIIAYGKLLDDDAEASKVMRLYKIYSALLSKKYGNAQEFFTPAQINVTKQNDKGKDIVVQEAAPMGNPNFLSQLQSGAAELYSTYYNEEVGAALAVNVDGDGKSYIVIDYKNLRILNAQEQETLDAL